MTGLLCLAQRIFSLNMTHWIRLAFCAATVSSLQVAAPCQTCLLLAAGIIAHLHATVMTCSLAYTVADGLNLQPLC